MLCRRHHRTHEFMNNFARPKMESVGQLASGVAHDFNNILTVIQGHSWPAHVPPHPLPAMTASIQAISFASERATSLTRQLPVRAQAGDAAALARFEGHRREHEQNAPARHWRNRHPPLPVVGPDTAHQRGHGHDGADSHEPSASTPAMPCPCWAARHHYHAEFTQVDEATSSCTPTRTSGFLVRLKVEVHPAPGLMPRP